jgi:hypothetical protein
MPKAGGEVGLARTHQHHVARAVLVAIRNRKALDRMVPQDAPTRSFGDGQARDLGAVLGGGDKFARRGCGHGEDKEEGR